MSAKRSIRRSLKRASPILLLLLFTLVSRGSAQGINGEWTGKMEGNQGPFDISFTFAVRADTLAKTDTLVGDVKGPMGRFPICDGRVNGNEFSFGVMFGGNTIAHQCTLAGDSIVVRYTGFEGRLREIILRRVADVNHK